MGFGLVVLMIRLKKKIVKSKPNIYNIFMDKKTIKKTITTPGFTKEVIEELKKVSWPSKKATTRLTMVVVLISLIIGIYVGIIDILLTKGLDVIMKLR